MKNFFRKLKSGWFYILIFLEISISVSVFVIKILPLGKIFVLISILLQLFYILNFIILYVDSYKKYGDNPLKSFINWIKSFFAKKNIIRIDGVKLRDNDNINISIEFQEIKDNMTMEEKIEQINSKLKNFETKLKDLKSEINKFRINNDEIVKENSKFKKDTNYHIETLYLGQKDYPIFNHFLMIFSIIALIISTFF